MAEEKFAVSLQHAVLATLCFDEKFGSLIASQVKPEYFDGVYRDFATRVLNYRGRYRRAPGKEVVHDLADQAAFGKDNSLVKKRLLPLLFEAAESLNAEYAAHRVQDFAERQVYKAALIEGGDRFGSGQQDDDLVPDLRKIFTNALRFRQQTMDAGTFLNDPNALSFLNHRDDVVSLGIPELDNMRIGLIPKQMLLYLGPKGSGKTWFCVHCGKRALLQRQKVVHYTLEMGEVEVIPRYYQSLFSVALDSERYNRTIFEFDELGRVSGFKTRRVTPQFDLTQPGIKSFLKSKMKTFGTRFSNLVVKEFATGSLTMQQLVGHLDYLAEVEGFVPNVCIIDYPKLMYMDKNNLRLHLGRTVEEIRGLGVERNMAMVVPHQGTRATIGAKRTRSRDAGEDISVIQTADTVLAFSRTEAEERLGLGRLSVEHARKSRGGAIILLSQAYEIGQYALSSAIMQKAYWERLRDFSTDEEEDDE